MSELEPSCNLWSEPWITAERDGRLERVSIERLLLGAAEFRALHDPSPLVVVGLHRLLTAILQDVLQPTRPPDLRRLWAQGHLPEDRIRNFGQAYGHRFDLFAAEEPFLQSGDIPRALPVRASDLKPVTYLMPDFPAGSEVAHYRHGLAAEVIFCSTCAARGLVTVPPFATSGGAGIKPSINGVPPIYVLPGGATLFESLIASLVLPDYQPSAASPTGDTPWWRRPALVGHKAEVSEVSYLHSLTFPARRVRLYPEAMDQACSRCGEQNAWGVRSMVYQMGESRPKDAPPWFDPFAAYRLRSGKEPVPIRPVAGKALWREYGSLFLPSAGTEKATMPPSVLAQLANEDLCDELGVYPFRCVGLRTDMKAKVFEWVDVGFDVPLPLVRDAAGCDLVRQGVDLSTDCAGLIAGTFRQAFAAPGRQGERHGALRARMIDAYWTSLSTSFRRFALDGADPQNRDSAWRCWVEQVIEAARSAFKSHSEMTGGEAASLRQRVSGQRICDMKLGKRRKDALGE